MRSAAALCVLLAGTALAAGPAAAQSPKKFFEREVVGHVYEPELLEATDERIAGLKVPNGFKVEKFADGLRNPRIIAVADDGTVYVTRRELGDVVMLRDTDGDMRADHRKVVAARPRMHGIALDGRLAYLVTVEDVYRTEIADDGTFGELERIVDDLPVAGQHPNRTIFVGPDKMLYVTVGSTCNACAETSPELATVLKISPDGEQRSIFASGLRNTIGLDWHPETRDLYAMDMGIDWLGDDDQPEELNRLVEGKKYGWPYIYADGKENPQDEPPGDMTMEQWRKGSEPPALLYTAHASPLQFTFYEGGQFPAEYRGDAFVTFRGSWNRKPPSGYEVVRVRFRDGRPAAFEPFLTGFLSETEGGRHAYTGRPVGLATLKDGSLLVGDDTNGVIYRVSYAGPQAAEKRADATVSPAPAGRNPLLVLTGTGAGAATKPAVKPPAAELKDDADAAGLAINLPDTKAAAPLEVRSDAFKDNARIPGRFSAYDENFSPALSWSKGPDGTRAYVVMMEDPDAKEPKPYVHWIAYGVPAGTTRLREGLLGQPRLTDPEGLMQGQNSYGSVGWQGMKPPAGDPAHQYHFQVFALDREPALEPGATRDEVIAAMRGHVLAAGELVGTFSNKAEVAKSE